MNSYKKLNDSELYEDAVADFLQRSNTGSNMMSKYVKESPLFIICHRVLKRNKHIRFLDKCEKKDKCETCHQSMLLQKRFYARRNAVSELSPADRLGLRKLLECRYTDDFLNTFF